MLMAAFFSATGATDAFYIAFRIPNLVRRLVGEGVFTISFIPVYTEYLVSRGLPRGPRPGAEDPDRPMAVLTVLVALGMIFAPAGSARHRHGV